jgi:transposase
MNLKDLCRLLLTTELTNRQVGSAAGVSHNTAVRYRTRLIEEELSWHEVGPLSEAELESRLNRGRMRWRQRFVEPDFGYAHGELRKPGVTISLLYEEYAAATPSGAMSETEYRRRYDRFERSLGVVMRQPRLPGYQLFLDYSGKRPSITHRETGERRPVELFIAVMGASRRTFAYATATQRLPDWCEANVKALEYIGGVPVLLVPDNLKSAVDRVTKTEGHVINFTYSALARHYDCVVLPARPRRPKDKAPVEIGVLFAQRWILGRLRNRTFYSLEELNQAIAELLQRMNDKPMRGHGGKSRNQLFEELDRPALKPLPQHPYEYADWKLAITVAQDYHVVWDEHHYSVPYRYVGAKVRIRATARMIEVYHKNENFPIATHLRSNIKDACTTNPEHQPASHRAYAQDQGAELIAWAERSGPSINRFMKTHIEKHRRPMMSIQAFRGLKSLAREHGIERLDAACHRALRLNATSITSVRSMLQRGMESAPLRGEAANDPLPTHENVRGSSNYE